MTIPLDNFFTEDLETEQTDSATPSKNRGGRPKQINTDRVLNHRDQLIEILSFGWGEIGWQLITARTCNDLRSAFACLRGLVHSNEYLLRLFVRVTTIAASASEIRETKKKRARVVSTIYKLSELREPLAEKLRRSSGTLKQKTNNENLETLLEEHFQRTASFRKIAHDLECAEKELKELEIKLEEQEASYAQIELLKFIQSGKYAHHPRNIAQAMAGLPEIGCSYSFQQCEKKASPLWPTRPEEIPTLSYRMFRLIEECCNLRSSTDQTLVDLLRERMRAIPPLSDLGNSLKPDWRYLRQAVEQTDLTHSPSGAAPYRIFAAFIKNRGQSRSSEESTLAEIESAQI